MTKASPRTEMTSDIKAIVDLYEKFGKTQSSRLLGLTDITHLIRAGYARPAYVIAAQALLDKEKDKDVVEDNKPKGYVIKLTKEDQKVLLPILEKFGVSYMELDF